MTVVDDTLTNKTHVVERCSGRVYTDFDRNMSVGRSYIYRTGITRCANNHTDNSKKFVHFKHLRTTFAKI